eukprot:TRINITY_DN10706_c0_g1_i1.p1 TRINITY_DN10706_c0_g1~~TRINITY_DN10706_c0_g1_i1.p1  ORF type:complete len:772 (+),score=197.96 TRINITY_DN10706_c0_g1_i1:73-2388(+)
MCIRDSSCTDSSLPCFVGEDREHPVTELMHSSPGGKGWQSPRFCSFPQTIVLQFKSPVFLGQIQLLSHQTKISTKVELLVHFPATEFPSSQEVDRLRFKRIGHLSLGSNENNGFKARELKSVYVETPAYLLKLVLHKCYVNKYNIFNQVGLVAINCLGVPLDAKEKLSEPVPVGQALEEIGTFDPITLDNLKALNIAKENAVNEENFDKAKEIKDIMTRLRLIGPELASLDRKKRQAVENEDYELARAIKAESDRLRESAFEEPKAKSHSEYALTDEYLPLNNEYVLEENKSLDLATGKDKVLKSAEPIMQNELRSSIVFSRKEASGYLGGEEPDMQSSAVLPALKNRGRISADIVMEPEDSVEPLSEESRKIAEPYYDLLESELLRKLFSKNWSNREAGLDIVQHELATRSFNQIKNVDDERTMANLLGLVGHMVDDNIAQVSIKAMDVIEELLRFYPKEVENYRSIYMGSVDQCMSSLMNKIGDNTSKVKAKSEATCVKLAVEGKFPLSAFILHCTRAPKKASNRHIQGKLSLLIVLFKELKEHAKDLACESVIEFGLNGAKSGNGDVRNAGYGLLVEVYKHIGTGINGYLGSLRPAQRDVLQAEFDKLGASTCHQEEPFVAQPAPAPNKSITKLPVSQIPEDPDKTCEYCGKYDAKFDQDNLDLHMLNDCPMLYLCLSCGKIIEIININSHLLTECEGRKSFAECPVCCEAVSKHELDTHVDEGACNPADNAAIRCPLCHMDVVPATIEAWRNHILVQQCPNNERRPI